MLFIKKKVEDNNLQTKKFNHISVLLEESIEGLSIKKDGMYVDGTLRRGRP